MSKQGSLRKSYFVFSNPTSKYPFKEYRPHRPKSYVLWICLSESQGAAQPERIAMWPLHGRCWLYDRAKTDQTYCSELLVHMPRLDDHIVFLCFLCYCSYYHSSHLPRGIAMFSLISHLLSDSNFPFRVLAKCPSFPPPFPLFLPLPLFLCIFLGFSFPKGKALS